MNQLVERAAAHPRVRPLTSRVDALSGRAMKTAGGALLLSALAVGFVRSTPGGDASGTDTGLAVRSEPAFDRAECSKHFTEFRAIRQLAGVKSQFEGADASTDWAIEQFRSRGLSDACIQYLNEQ